MIPTELNFRPEVVEECFLGGMTPAEALHHCVELSTRAFAIEWKGELLCYWGFRAGSFASSSAQAWMLSTDAITKYPIYAARKSRKLLDLLLEDHYAISVIVDGRFEVAVRWLEWLGFERVGFVDRFDEMRVTRGGRA